MRGSATSPSTRVACLPANRMLPLISLPGTSPGWRTGRGLLSPSVSPVASVARQAARPRAAFAGWRSKAIARLAGLDDACDYLTEGETEWISSQSLLRAWPCSCRACQSTTAAGFDPVYAAANLEKQCSGDAYGRRSRAGGGGVRAALTGGANATLRTMIATRGGDGVVTLCGYVNIGSGRQALHRNAVGSGLRGLGHRRKQ